MVLELYCILTKAFLFNLQAYSGTPLTEEKEKIVWVRFENADLNGMTDFSGMCVLNALWGLT